MTTTIAGFHPKGRPNSMTTTIGGVTPRPGPKPSGNARIKGKRVPLSEAEGKRVDAWSEATDTRAATFMRDALLREVEAWERAEKRRHRTPPA
jgi:hypothetical protein